MERIEKESPRAEAEAVKAGLRRRMAGLRAAWSPDDVLRLGARLVARLEGWTVAAAARRIAAYRALPGEPALDGWLERAAREGRAVCVPVFDAERGRYAWARWTPGEPERKGRYGLPEPVAPRWTNGADVDLALVPGLAFDAAGRRLGRGGGHYDRLLAGTGGLRVGVAFEAQVLEAVPAEPHDVRMNALLTEERLLFCVKENDGLSPDARPATAAKNAK